MSERNEEAYKFWRETLQGAKFVLAPMVDQSELPWRMLTRKYGAQLAYTPMMHASVFVRDPTYRLENFTTCPQDRPLIAQFCTDDPDTLVRAAKMIEDQVDAVDLNLGCPQHIARRGHYGAFLQDEWDLIFNILSNAVKNLKVPVTAKIRVFEDIEKSVEYAKMIEKTGISLLAVHGRTREQKGPDTGLASWKHIKAIKDAVKIPVFANGNILCFNDVLECIKETGCEGVMIAEPNLYNPALFANINPVSWQMGSEYLEFVDQYPCSFASIRGHLFKIFFKVFERHTELRDKIARIRDIDEVKETIKEIEAAVKAEDTYEEENNKWPGGETIPYWRCQSYVRSLSSQVAIRENEDMCRSVTCTNSQEAKKHLDEISSTLNDESVSGEERAVAIKLVKLLDRKKRKLERIERKMAYRAKTAATQPVAPRPLRYVFCKTCKNPKGQSCTFELCRMCCKEKVFTQNVECKGHGLKVWRTETNETEQQPTEAQPERTLENVAAD